MRSTFAQPPQVSLTITVPSSMCAVIIRSCVTALLHATTSNNHYQVHIQAAQQPICSSVTSPVILPIDEMSCQLEIFVVVHLHQNRQEVLADIITSYNIRERSNCRN